MDRHQLTAELKQRARAAGFDLCGVAPAGPSERAAFLRHWLDAGRHGEMAWMAGRFAERADVRKYLPGAKSVFCCAMSYNVELQRPPQGAALGRIARYALGEDYHQTLKSRLLLLADWLRATAGGETRACVDTAPVLEREWAARSGVGWQGKNTCTINTGYGSYLLLGEIITTLDLPPDAPAIDRCGTCRRCIEACPTQALAPYQLDATRCLSYWNIESRGEIPAEIAAVMGDRLFGCDICQEVCPWNRKAPIAINPSMQPRFPSGAIEARELLEWTDDDYRQRLRRSAVKRVKLPMLKRNARVVLRNLGTAVTQREHERT